MLSLMDHAPVPMFLYDQRIIYTNTAFKQFIGYNQDELHDMFVWELIEPLFREEIKQAISKRLVNDMQPKEYQFRMFTRHRQYRWVHLVAKTVQYEDHFIGFASLFDITDKKKLEEELIQSNQLWSDMFNQHSAVMLLVDPDSGHIVDANSSAAWFYGYSVEQLKQMYIHDLNLLPNVDISERMGRARNKVENDFIFEHKKSNGEIRTVQVYSTVIHSNHKDVLFSIIHDITERITFERELTTATSELEESEKRYRFLFENSTDMIVHLTSDFAIQFVSSACVSLLGYQPAELIGQQLLTLLIHSEDRELYVEGVAENKEKETTIEHRMQSKNGTYCWFESKSVPFKNSHGELNGFLVVSRDITLRKRQEEKWEKLHQSLMRFSYQDALTGIANRRSFDEHLQQSWNNERELCLILIDIDYFKKFNDYYGHQQGDICLKQVADCLKKTVKRSNDFVGRYGGEEFVVVLSDTNLPQASRVAEQVRHNVEAMHIPHAESDVSRYVTISVGVCLARQAEDAEHLITKADQALYIAKHKGRNRIVFFC